MNCALRNMKNLSGRFAVVVLMLVLSISVFADTIRLKDGSIIKGRISGFSDGKFTIEIGQGPRKRQLTIDVSEVASIEFDAVTGVGSIDSASNSSTTNSTSRYETVVTQPSGNNQPRSGSERPTPVSTSPTIRETSSQEDPSTSASSSAKPIEISVRVMADNTSNGWTNSGWVVRKGQRIRISGSGEASLGKGVMTSPAGLWDHEDPGKLLKAVPTGALLAVVGDDNNDFIYIGSEREFVAARDGALFLGINEGNLNDNSGAFTVKIEIFPGT